MAPPNSHDLDATATQEVVAPPTVEPLRAATPPLVVDGLEDAREQMPKLVPGTSIEALICSYSWPCEQALRIAMCESTMGQNPDAYADWNPNKGAFQIWEGPLPYLARVAGITNLLDDAQNVEAAWILSEEGTTWHRWACQP